MQKSVLRIPTESGKANISCDGDLTELLGINLCGFKDYSSVEDGMADAYDTWGMSFKIILFQYFQRYFNSEAPKDLILKTSNGHSVNAVLDLWHLVLYLVHLALQTYIDKKGIDYYQMFGWQNAVF